MCQQYELRFWSMLKVESIDVCFNDERTDHFCRLYFLVWGHVEIITIERMYIDCVSHHSTTKENEKRKSQRRRRRRKTPMTSQEWAYTYCELRCCNSLWISRLSTYRKLKYNNISREKPCQVQHDGLDEQNRSVRQEKQNMKDILNRTGIRWPYVFMAKFDDRTATIRQVNSDETHLEHPSHIDGYLDMMST
jgi:hypothetical protein